MQDKMLSYRRKTTLQGAL